MPQKKKNKTQNVAYVHNPSVDFIVGGEDKRKNPMKSKKSSSKGKSSQSKSKGKKKNPANQPAVGKKKNPNRKPNPDKVTSLFVTAAIAGVAFCGFDALINRVAPGSSATIRAGIKLSGAYAMQTWGSRIPVIKKYNQEIALVLAVLGFVDIFQLHILPLVNGATGGALSFLSPTGAGSLSEMSGGFTYQALPAYADEEEYADAYDEYENAY